MSRITVYPTARQAALIPNHSAIVWEGEVITHAELEERVVADASRLKGLGVMPGDRIALGAANSADWVIVAHAVVRMGAILVPLNTRLTTTEIRERLSIFSPRLILGDADFLATVAADVATMERLLLIGSRSGRLAKAEAQWPSLIDVDPGSERIGDKVDSDSVCTIITTSGSSGHPKGVCLTLANHLASAESSHQNLGCGNGDRWLVNLPLYHVGGLAIIYRAALCGFAVLIQDGFSAEKTLAAIRSEGVSHLSLVEATLARLLDANGERHFPGKVRAALIGGGPTDVALLSRARALGLHALPTYGLTEAASQVATLDPGAPDSLLGTVGRPMRSCDLRVRDSEGQEVSVGEEGEIWIRGPMVTPGYWTENEEVKPAVIGGWLPTGDMGIVDTDGYLTVRGRKDEMIISGGENIHPAEIERELMRLPGVHRAAVIGVKDRKWGQVPLALVEPISERENDPDGWMSLLRHRISGYKLPRKIITVTSLPRASIGKIDRSRLHEIYVRMSKPHA